MNDDTTTLFRSAVRTRAAAHPLLAGAILCFGCAMEEAAPDETTASEQPIIGGTFVGSATKYPGMGALLAENSDGTFRQFCGGTLIHPDWVLTAAHCFDPSTDGNTTDPADQCVSEPWTCRVQFNTLDLVNDGPGTEFFEVIRHPQYNITTKDNDIALVYLASTMTNVSVAPLLTKTQMDAFRGRGSSGNLLFIGESTLAVGWGLVRANGVVNEEDDVASDTRLKESAALEYVGTGSACNAWSRYDEEFGPSHITSNMICSGSRFSGNHGTVTDSEGNILPRSASDACYGDSGGPLFLPLPQGGYAQIGVTSFGYGCAIQGFPGVYTRASNYVSTFIAQEVGPVTTVPIPVRYGSLIGLRSAVNGNLRRYTATTLRADTVTTSSSSSFQLCRASADNNTVTCSGALRLGEYVVIRAQTGTDLSGQPIYDYVSDTGANNAAVMTRTFNNAAKWRVLCGSCTYPYGTLLEPNKDRLRFESLSALKRLKSKESGVNIVALTGGGDTADWRIEQREYRQTFVFQ